MLTVTLLGTGDAAGIPVHGCNAPPCQEARRAPWLRRRQTCVLVQSEKTNVLLDMGDKAHIESLCDMPIDAVFITHLHFDHYAGLHALRWSEQPGGIPVYYPEGSKGDDTMVLKIGGSLTFHAMKRFDQIEVKDVKITAVPLSHGTTATQGYVVESEGKSAALLTDTGVLPEETFAWLADHKPNLALIDACYRPGFVATGHNSVDTAIEIIQRLDVDCGVLIHIAPHNWSYRELVPYAHERDNGRTVVSYDGMVIHLY